MPEPSNPRGRGRQDPVTGLHEWYDLDYEVTRTTGDKLQAVLNGLAPEQELVSAHFQGGRDWTVISRRATLPVPLVHALRALEASGQRGTEAVQALRSAMQELPR